MSAMPPQNFGALVTNYSDPSGAFTNFAVDTNTDAFEAIVQAPEAIVITRLGVRYGARNGTPPTYKVSLQGVDTAGNPDGTIKGGGSPASTTFTPPADTSWDGTWRWFTLDNPFTCARGDFLAIVIARDSGTADASNSSSFTRALSFFANVAVFPYAIQNNATVRTRSVNPPAYGLGSATTAYGLVIAAKGVKTISTGTTPDEYALRFKLDADWGSTFQVIGVKYAASFAAAHNIKFILYDGTSVLQDVTIDGDHGSGSANSWRTNYFDETTLSALNFGSEYRLSFTPQDATSVTPYFMTVNANADLSAWPGGIEFYASSRTDAGAWSDTDTERPLFEPLIANWTKPVSGGPIRSMIVAGQNLPVY